MTDGWTDRDVADLADEYEIIDELGRGASAVVYRARDRALDRLVAIKVVRPHAVASGQDALERLAREARTIARLSHPNIVTLYAVRRLPSAGGLALVMQLVPGGTLKDTLVAQGALDPERVEAILRDVASALAYANNRGIVHRDVKPENIFLDEETGRALLADFGIAWSMDQESRLTMTGAAIGTPTYMAPEQIDGASPDARSDLYSLGLVAWEMCTGRRPWDGESLFNVILKQKTEELPPIDVLRPGVIPDRLQYIVERMLQKHPGARWAGADAALDKLERWVVPADYPQWHQSRQRRREEARLKALAAERAAPASPSDVATVVFRRDGAVPVPALPSASGATTALAPEGATDAPQLVPVTREERALPAPIQERPPTWVLEAIDAPDEPITGPSAGRIVASVLAIAATLALVIGAAVPTVREPVLASWRSLRRAPVTTPVIVPPPVTRLGVEPQASPRDSVRSDTTPVDSANAPSVTASEDSLTAVQLAPPLRPRAEQESPKRVTSSPPRAAEAPKSAPAERVLSPFAVPRVQAMRLSAPTVVTPTVRAPAVRLPASPPLRGPDAGAPDLNPPPRDPSAAGTVR
jgi:serine/threonine protein kinase